MSEEAKKDALTKVENVVLEEESPLGRIVITQAQVELIKNTVAIGATDDELKLFFFECRRRGVHPLDRMIHFIKRRSGDEGDKRATFQTSIDFLRSQAEETNEYRGQDDPEYGPLDEKGYPEWAKVVVKRKDATTGEVYGIPGRAYWKEYYPGDKQGFMWRKMPHSQLAKCAEAIALRKAFPKKLASLYSFEEMEQADLIDLKPIKEPESKKVTEGTGSKQLQEGEKKQAEKKEEKTTNGEKKDKKETKSAIGRVVTYEKVDGAYKDGPKKGQNWTMFVSEIADNEAQVKYRTFDAKLGAILEKEKGSGMLLAITYSTSQFGRHIEALDYADREPGMEG